MVDALGYRTSARPLRSQRISLADVKFVSVVEIAPAEVRHSSQRPLCPKRREPSQQMEVVRAAGGHCP
jgi:hypothetical protein